MPDAVSDSSTLIHLAKIGRLHLLFEFHNNILIAPAVWREVVQEGREWPGSAEVEEGRQSGWIDVVAPSNQSLIRFLQKDLHVGESETIALAVELNSEVVFLDESEARKTAAIYGLNISGVIGILIRAKQEERITSLKKELDRLRDDAGFWIGEEIYKRPCVLRVRTERQERRTGSTKIAAFVERGCACQPLARCRFSRLGLRSWPTVGQGVRACCAVVRAGWSLTSARASGQEASRASDQWCPSLEGQFPRTEL